MPARNDIEQMFLLQQQGMLQQLKNFLEESAILESETQRKLITRLRVLKVVLKLQVEGQNQLRNDLLLKQASEKYDEAYRVRNNPIPKIHPEEALQVVYVYAETRFEILRKWIREIVRVLVDDVWRREPTPEQLKDTLDKIILPLIEAAKKDFMNGLRCDVLTDVYDSQANTYKVEFPENIFQLVEQDFCESTRGRLTKLARSWGEYIDDQVWTAEQRITTKEREKSQGKASGPQSRTFTNSSDYRCVTMRGEKFALTSRQAQIIQILDENRKNGHPDVGKDYILEKIGSQNSRLRDSFKTNPGAWKALVKSGAKRAIYCLNI